MSALNQSLCLLWVWLIGLPVLAASFDRAEFCRELFPSIDSLPGAEFLLRDYSKEILEWLQIPIEPAAVVDDQSLQLYHLKRMHLQNSLKQHPLNSDLIRELTLVHAAWYAKIGVQTELFRWQQVLEDGQWASGYGLKFKPQRSRSPDTWLKAVDRYLHSQPLPIQLSLDVAQRTPASYLDQQDAVALRYCEADARGDHWQRPLHSQVIFCNPEDLAERSLVEHEIFHALQAIGRKMQKQGSWPRTLIRIPQNQRSQHRNLYLHHGLFVVEEIGAQLQSAIFHLAEARTSQRHGKPSEYAGELAQTQIRVHAQTAYDLASYLLFNSSPESPLLAPDVKGWVESYHAFIARHADVLLLQDQGIKGNRMLRSQR